MSAMSAMPKCHVTHTKNAPPAMPKRTSPPEVTSDQSVAPQLDLMKSAKKWVCVNNGRSTPILCILQSGKGWSSMIKYDKVWIVSDIFNFVASDFWTRPRCQFTPSSYSCWWFLAVCHMRMGLCDEYPARHQHTTAVLIPGSWPIA